MTHDASTNGPSEDDIRSAFSDILGCHEQLATEQGIYMRRCQTIRGDIAAIYDAAKEKGVTKKVLKAQVKRHTLLKKAEKCRDDLEADEQNEFDKIVEKLGPLADLPLGVAALQATNGGAALDSLNNV